MRANAPTLAAAVTVAALLAACATTATGGSGVGSASTTEVPAPKPTASKASAATPPTLPPLERLPSTEVAVDGAPGALLRAYGGIWVMSHRGTLLRRINPTDLKVTGTVDTGVLGCGDISAGAGSIWISGCGATPGLVRVDPRQLRVLSTHGELNGLGPGFHSGDLWIAAGSNGVIGLRRADPEHLDKPHTVAVAGLVEDAGVVEAAGSIWVAGSDAVVYRVNPQTEEVLAAVPFPLGPGQPYLITHDGAPWYIDHGKGALARVDPTTNAPSVLTLRPVSPPEYRGVAASSAPGRPGKLWIRSGSDEAWLIDTRTDEVIRRIAIGDGGGGDLEEVDGHLWVANFGLDTLQRIQLR
jgi:hypothetical protein